MLKVYQYPKCGTCRKALKWLDAHDIDYKSIDITQKPPSKAELKRALAQSGLPITKLFNTSGQLYREGKYKERLQTMTTAQAIDALAAQGKLIKRPLVFGNDFTLVGFDERAYAEQLG